MLALFVLKCVCLFFSIWLVPVYVIRAIRNTQNISEKFTCVVSIVVTGFIILQWLL